MNLFKYLIEGFNPGKSFNELTGFLARSCHMKDASKLHYDLEQLQNILKPDGMLWVSWDKTLVKKGGTNENDVRNAALSLSLVDVKVCAVSEQWSGLKLMIRKNLR